MRLRRYACFGITLLALCACNDNSNTHLQNSPHVVSKIAIPNIGSMFIGMVKDTSTFTVIGLLEVVRVTQNLNSTTFQPFVLYTAAAALYVVAAFGIDLLFRTIEKLLATPPSGRVARAVSRRRRKRLEAVMLRLESASSRT